MPVARKIFRGKLADMRLEKIKSLKGQMRKGKLDRKKAKSELDNFTERFLQRLLRENKHKNKGDYLVDLTGHSDIKIRRELSRYFSLKPGTLEHLLWTDPFAIEERHLKGRGEWKLGIEAVEESLRDDLVLSGSKEYRLSDELLAVLNNVGVFREEQVQQTRKIISRHIDRIKIALVLQEAFAKQTQVIIHFLKMSEKETFGERRKNVRAMLKRIKDVPEVNQKLKELRAELKRELHRFLAIRKGMKGEN